MAFLPKSQVKGVHLVGSIPAASAEECFRTVCPPLHGRIERVPDGETGERDYFNRWRMDLPMFKQQPVLIHDFINPDVPTTFTNEEADKLVDAIGEIETGYDKAALESYEVFQRLRDEEGVVPENVRFLLCLPTPVCTLGQFVRRALVTRVEAKFEAAYLQALDKIQKAIPAQDLSIQWDAPIEFAILEGGSILGPGHEMRAWFEPAFEGALYVQIKCSAGLSD